jgi:hypothetical protein
VGFAHGRGVVHRDLKPGNIHIQPTGHVKVLDFGLARLGASDMTKTGTVMGTPHYMAPEQLLGRPTDARTDQFGFGVTLHELCTGRHPFGGSSLPSIIAQILAAEPVPPRPDEAIPLAAWHLIERCLQKDPASRFPTTRDLVSALEAVLLRVGDDRVASRRPGLGEPTPADPDPPASAGHVSARGEAGSSPAPGSSEVSGEPAPVASHAALRVTAALGWWRFHQIAAALAYPLMAWPAWVVHRFFGRAGLFFFLTLLAAVVVSGILRLHLWFSSKVYPEDLPAQRRDVGRWIWWADVCFTLLLIAGGLALPPEAVAWAAILISFGVGAALAFLIIEPATARAAFRDR